MAVGGGGRSSSSYSYYDIDTILAEEELIPAVTVFDMNHLAFLDPDGVHDRHRRRHSNSTSTGASASASASGQSQKNNKKKKRSNIDDDSDDDDGNDSDNDDEMKAAAAAAEYAASSSILPEKSKIKLPLWTVNQWVQLNYARPSLPRHYGRKARERYDADPGDADLRKRNERFFLAGRMLVDVLERGADKGLKELNKHGSTSSNKIAHRQALEVLASEVQELRRTIIKLYAGERLRRIFDWSSSGMGAMDGNVDDVSSYLERLTAMERQLFYTGQNAVASFDDWKMFGNRRLLMGPVRPPRATSVAVATTTTAQQQEQTKRRTVTPGGGGATGADGGDKRRRVY